MTPAQPLTPQPFALADIAQSLGKAPQTITVAVGMSGGVDSSVSALLLKQAGFDVVGLFMKNWEEDDGTKYCTALQDFADARAVANTIGIPLQAVNFATDYWDNVFEIFLHEYQIGHTPNPDILCNKEIKFKAFLDYAQSLGADFIATGHYARRTHAKDGKAGLLCGLDAAKDQSYFLHAVSGEKLAKTLFPIGELQKSQVRAIAKHHQLATASKKDSTGICFIGERNFKAFLQSYLPAQPGDIISDDGQKIGRHDGLMYYTIGQRSGLGIGGVAGRSDAPWFVLEKDLSNNRLIVGQGHNHPALQYRSLHAIRPNWVIAPPPLDAAYQCDAKTRYRQADQPCTITTNIAAASIDQELDVNFDAPVQAVTPGQSVVFYAGECCLGGAVIDSASH